jgi:hypothetical protein
MHIAQKLLHGIAILTFNSSGYCEPPSWVEAQKALAIARAALPESNYALWTSERGDMNGDGILDIALIMTAPNADGPRHERLVVLAGTAGGGYSVISASGDFCQIRHWYNLSFKDSSLYVTGYVRIHSSFTFQFRYTAAMRDLELVSMETLSEDPEASSYDRKSVNYRSGVVAGLRKVGTRYKEASTSFATTDLARLNGFDCLNFDDKTDRLSIRDDFSVESR